MNVHKNYDLDHNLNNSINMNMAIPIPDSISKLPLEKQNIIKNYLVQMNEREKRAYLIAFQHLGSSFNIYKSNGFKEWLKKQDIKI